MEVIMTNQKHIHIISHTHWDREWYLPYEKHHMKLIDLMDTLLETLKTDSNYRSFHLDGQTIILDDYLQVRDRKSTRLNSSHVAISYAVFCLKKKKKIACTSLLN